MKEFPIKNFGNGIDTTRDETDSDRGTLRRADGVLTEPVGALSSGPVWGVAWGLSALGTSIETALSGADAAKVHFVTVARSGHTLLVAWDMAAHRARGCWQVVGTGSPSFSASSGASVTATSGSVYRDKTAALNWYGSWVGNRLILGNGTDTNLVWESGALAALFPSSPTNTYDPNRAAFPPCKSFVADRDSVLYGAGNVTNPLYVYLSEKPSSQYPKPYGVYDTDTSFVKVSPNAGGTAVTALSVSGSFVVAHLDEGGAVALYGWERTQDGYKCGQAPVEAHAGAINPACAYDRSQGPLYFGTDLEVYLPPKPGHWRLREDRTVILATDRSSGFWNAQMAKPAVSADTFTIWDNKNGRLWVWAPLTVGRQGLYCYNQPARAVTGPFRYPDFTCASPIRDPNAPGFQVMGITRDGALLYADLDAVQEDALPEPSTAQGADYTVSATPVVSTTGIPGVQVDTANEVFVQTLNGESVHMNGAWSDFASSTAPAVTEYFKDAYLAIIELVAEDFGSPLYLKNTLEIHLQWRRNQRVYAGVYVESDGHRDGQWLGAPYPDEEQVAFPNVRGTRTRIRIICVFFNGSRAVLPDVTVMIQQGKTGR